MVANPVFAHIANVIPHQHRVELHVFRIALHPRWRGIDLNRVTVAIDAQAEMGFSGRIKPLFQRGLKPSPWLSVIAISPIHRGLSVDSPHRSTPQSVENASSDRSIIGQGIRIRDVLMPCDNRHLPAAIALGGRIEGQIGRDARTATRAREQFREYHAARPFVIGWYGSAFRGLGNICA